MLADDDDAVHREFAAAERQRLRDRRIHLHRRKALGAIPAQVAVSPIWSTYSETRSIGGMMVRSVPAVAFEEAVDDMLRVGILEVCRGDGRDLRPLSAASARR